MNRVYGYIRVSTETQADKGYGIDTQRSAIIDYCKNNSIELVRIFADEGISGTIGDTDDISKRQGLVQLLAALNGINTVLVMNTSRLWRDEQAKVFITREIRKLGGNIISIEQPRYSLYTKDPQDFLYNSMMEMLDTYERMCISLKLAKGRATKANHGDKPTGVTPYGYKYSANKKHIVIDENEAVTVKRIFSLAQSGYSLKKIADILNSEHIYTRRHNKWSKAGLQVILKNDFYTGVLTYRQTKITGTHTALISKVQCGKVQAQLQKKNKHRKE